MLTFSIGLDEVEYATLEWVDWFDHRRLLEPIGYVPPAEFEKEYSRKTASEKDRVLRQTSLQETRGGSLGHLSTGIEQPASEEDGAVPNARDAVSRGRWRCYRQLPGGPNTCGH